MRIASPYLFILAVASGNLLVLSFPDASWGLLAWVALAPLFVVCIEEKRLGRLFLYCYTAGVIFFTGSCYWIYHVMRAHGQLGVPAAMGVFTLFVLIFGLFFGAFGVLAGLLAGRWQARAMFLFPFVWVAVEWARTYVPFGGFPWNLLGYAVAPYPGYTQLASATGIYGISLVVAIVNAAVAAAWLSANRRAVLELAGAGVALALMGWWGSVLPVEPTTHGAVLVQTNLPQLTRPDPNWVRNNAEDLVALSEMTAGGVASLDLPADAPTPIVIWPEVPVSLYFHHDPVLRARLISLAQRSRADFLTGIVDYRTAANSDTDDEDEGNPAGYLVHNSAVLLGSDGTFVGQYDKIHLVPFGEYLPMANLLGWAEPLVQEVSAFSPGKDYSVFPTADGPVSVLICYEAIFPGMTREFVRRGATVLVNVSNDGWFGRTAAAEQHLNMARIRAIETGRFLLRSTNTGITAIIDPAGRVVARAERDRRTVLTGAFGHRRDTTLYVRYGDWLAALCALLAAAAVGRRFWLDAVEVTV